MSGPGRIEVEDIEVEAYGRTFNVSFTRTFDGWDETQLTDIEYLDENGDSKPIGTLPMPLASSLTTAIDQWCEQHPVGPWDVYDEPE